MGYLGIIELQDIKSEFHIFEIIKNKEKLYFGTSCNTGFIPYGEMDIDDCFSDDKNLQELVAALQVMIDDGKRYVSDSVTVY